MAKKSELKIASDGHPEIVDLEELIGETIAAHPKGKQLDKFGREVPSPVPLAPPVGYKPQPTMFEHIRRLVRSEQVRQAAEAAGVETFEEADDFDVGEDYDPRSPYELQFDIPDLPAGAASPAGTGTGDGGQPMPAGERTPSPSPAEGSPAASPPAKPPAAP